MTLATRSLTRRLLIWLCAIQIAVPVFGMALWMLFSPFVTWQDVASVSASSRVAASAVRDAAGLRLQPDDALRAYAARRPGFAFAAAVDGKLLPGSDTGLLRALAPFAGAMPQEGALEIAMANHRDVAKFWQVPLADGTPAIIITAGNVFYAGEDLGAYITTYLPALVPIMMPSLLAAVIVVPLVIRAAIAPLRRAAAEAGGIGIDDLSRRLSVDGMPAEITPLIAAVNQALARLQQETQRMRRFHANAAHELRTPVAILQARLDALPGLPSGHALRWDVQRIAVLVEQILSVERLNACGRGDDIFDAVPCVRDVVADCAPLALRSAKEIAFVASVDSIPIRGTPRVLASAVANLIDNALRAEPAGGTVLVRIAPGPVIEVEDHGSGVPPADREQIFEPFWRKDNRPNGAGLGLPIVREIAQAHGGSITVHDTDGGGATFRLALAA